MTQEQAPRSFFDDKSKETLKESFMKGCKVAAFLAPVLGVATGLGIIAAFLSPSK